MAGRDNQGYLIAVIGLVMLSLVLALVAFLGMSKSSEYADNLADSQKELDFTKTLNRANETKANILLTMIGESDFSVNEISTQIDSMRGFGANLESGANRDLLREIEREVVTLKENFDRVVRSYTSSIEGEDLQETTYLTVINALNSALAKMHTDYNVKDRQRALAEQEKEALERDLTVRIDNLNTEIESLNEQLNREKEDSRQAQEGLRESLAKNLSQLQQAQVDHEQVRAGLSSELTVKLSDISKLEEDFRIAKRKNDELTRETFDRPDGQIVKVFPEMNSAIIDLGRVHGLNNNHTFSVYDRSITNFEKGKNKAAIEVVRILDRQAEVRITMEDPRDPILPGDWVLTPVWEPGQKVLFALAGVFDLDGDGYSDMERLIQMIRNNGGDVIAWHDDDGQIQGEIDSTIRYLVLGDSPQPGDLNVNPAISGTMNKMKGDAEANTIQIIDFSKLLQRMGVRSLQKVELLNRSVREREFQSRLPGGTLKDADR